MRHSPIHPELDRTHSRPAPRKVWPFNLHAFVRPHFGQPATRKVQMCCASVHQRLLPRMLYCLHAGTKAKVRTNPRAKRNKRKPNAAHLNDSRNISTNSNDIPGRQATCTRHAVKLSGARAKRRSKRKTAAPKRQAEFRMSAPTNKEGRQPRTSASIHSAQIRREFIQTGTTGRCSFILFPPDRFKKLGFLKIKRGCRPHPPFLIVASILTYVYSGTKWVCVPSKTSPHNAISGVYEV